METPLKVLLVEDCESDALLVDRALRRGGFAPKCTRVENAAEMWRSLKSESWDIIISDYTLPQFDGLAAYRIYSESGLDIPFIIVSGSIGEDLAVMAMKAGIHDYVMKNNLGRLVPAIQRELRDAAERRARRDAESRLKDIERLRLVGELTASLIHDLKNPLQSILMSSELLNSEDLDCETREKMCNVIDRQVQRMLAMSEEVLDFVRGDIRLALEPTQLDLLISEVVETYVPAFEKAGITLDCNVGGTASPSLCISCDRQRIWRALQNLISNAKDAMSAGGSITLRVTTLDGSAAIQVTDTGNGIPESIQSRLFEPFVSFGKKHGTGLGLAIVKNIVEAHGGMISFETKTGFGTTFTIKLPSSPSYPQGRQIMAETINPQNTELTHA